MVEAAIYLPQKDLYLLRTHPRMVWWLASLYDSDRLLGDNPNIPIHFASTIKIAS